MVGNINWLAMSTRPDLCFDAMEMACNFGKARVKDIKRAGRILSKAKNREMELRFNNLGRVRPIIGIGIGISVFFRKSVSVSV